MVQLSREEIVSQTKEYCTIFKTTLETILSSYRQLEATEGLSPAAYSGQIRAIATGSATVVSKAQEWTKWAAEEQYLQVDYLLNCAKQLRTAVDNFLKAIKDAMSNSLDFLSQENKVSLGKELEKFGKNILFVNSLLEQQCSDPSFMRQDAISPGTEINLRRILLQVNELALTASGLIETALQGNADAVNDHLNRFRGAIKVFEGLVCLSKDIRLIKQKLEIISKSHTIQAQDIVNKVNYLSTLTKSTDISYKQSVITSLKTEVAQSKEKLSENLLQILVILQKSPRETVIIPSSNDATTTAVQVRERFLKKGRSTASIDKGDPTDSNVVTKSKTTITPTYPVDNKKYHGKNLRNIQDLAYVKSVSLSDLNLADPTSPLKRTNPDPQNVNYLPRAATAKLPSPRKKIMEGFDELPPPTPNHHQNYLAPPTPALVDDFPRVNPGVILEAAMAAAIPLVVDEFKSKFSWFAKGWSKEGLAIQTDFNHLLQLKLTNLCSSQFEDAMKRGGGGLFRERNYTFTDNYPIQREPSYLNVEPMVMEENIEWIKPSRTVEERQISKAAIPELHDTVKSYQRIYQDLQVITLSIINCSEGNAQFTENQQELSEISMKLIKSLLYIITKLTSGYSSDTINSFRDKTTSEITKISLVGVRDENCITAVNNSNKNEIKKIINNLQYLIYNHSLIALQSSLNQLSNTIFSISTSTSQLVDSKILEIILTCRSIGTSLNKFLDLIATFTSVCGLIKYSELRSEDQFTEDDKLDNIWNYSSVDQLSIIDTATDLNQIVRYITSYTVNSKEKQEEILSCFLKTASLYFKPFDIVKKLEERYLNPRNAGLSKEQAAYIKNTVSEIILVWTAKNIHRLSDRSLNKLHKMASQFEEDGLSEASSKLEKIIEDIVTKQNQTFTCRAVITISPIDTHSSYILACSSKDIAQQLTLYDCELFYNLEMHELLGQAWSKDLTKNQAPHVVNTLNRLNQISYWVASVIIIQEKLHDRGAAYTHFVDVAAHLHEMRNYSSLMGIIAGINLAAVTRLMFTLGCVHESKKKLAEHLTKLMASESSFKNYRTSLKSCPLPLIPNIAVSLIDLTFIDDGNKSTNEDGKINLDKHKLTTSILTQLESYRAVKYDITPVEPLHSYLAELPCFSSDDLYTISNTREPRGADFKSII